MHSKTNKISKELATIRFTHHTDDTRKELLVNVLRKELVNVRFAYRTDTVNHNSFRRNS